MLRPIQRFLFEAGFFLRYYVNLFTWRDPYCTTFISVLLGLFLWSGAYHPGKVEGIIIRLIFFLMYGPLW